MPTRAAVRVLGAAVPAALAGYVLVYRRWAARWGATGEERSRAMPGDDVVAAPWFAATNAVSVRARPEQIWPWLVQMGGYTRAGWYSYDRVDNAGRPSADRIVPELQDLRVGDVMATSPGGDGFTVERIDPPRSLVLAIRAHDATVSSTYLLEPGAGGTTRLVNRVRFRILPSARTLGWALLMDAGHVVMARRMLLGIRDRAERLAREQAGDLPAGTPGRWAGQVGTGGPRGSGTAGSGSGEPNRRAEESVVPPVTSTATPTDPVRKIMADRLATVDTAETLRAVAQELVADEIGAVVVRSPGGPIGLISERDVLTVLATGGDVDEQQAVDVMTADLVAARPGDSIASVGRLMLDAGVRHIVVRDGDALVGLVSIRDVLAVVLPGGDSG